MANITNLKPFTTENAKEMGRKGGLASGITRKRNALIKKQFDVLERISNFIDSLTDTEYQLFLSDFSEAEAELINFYFKPTEKQLKKMAKKIKSW